MSTYLCFLNNKWVLLLLISLFLIHPKADAQQEGLTHLKTLPFDSPPYFATEGGCDLQYFPKDSIYTLKIQSEANTLNIGIWSEFITQGWHSDLKSKVIVYDRSFNPIDRLEIKFQNWINVIGVVDNKVFLRGWFPSVPINTNIAIPAIQWTHPQFDGNQFMLEYDLEEHALSEKISIRDSLLTSPNSSNSKPYPGFAMASGINGTSTYFDRLDVVVTNNHFVVGGKLFYDYHWVNEMLSENTTNNISYLSFKYNIADQSTSVIPVGPFPQSNLFNFRYFPSANSDGYYRIGSFRGTESEINPGHNTFYGTPTDSSYATYLTKENTEGESQFVSQLYSFNNLLLDTTILYANAPLYSRQTFHSLIEMDNRVYLSENMWFTTLVSPGDTLYFRDCFGNDRVYHQMVDNIFYGNEINEFHLTPYAKNLIFALSDTGEPEIMLSMVNRYLGIEGLRGQSQNPYVYKVGDHLAWVTNYYAIADTTIALVKETPGNNTDTTFVNLPAGKGSCIFWLNQDLDLIDFWNIPYSSPQFAGVQISYMGEYGTDTLLIQGYIPENTATSLDPFGNAETVLYSHSQIFLAFYSGLNLLTIKEAKLDPGFSIFPNPTSGTITIKQAENADFDAYSIYDLSGRKVKDGALPTGRSAIIAIDKLKPGMYILKCMGKDQTSSTKFVVK